MSIITKIIHNIIVRRAKEEAKQRLKKEGFALIDGDKNPLSNKAIKEVFAKMTKEHEIQIQGFVATTVGEINVPTTGIISDWWAALKLWLSNPANREKILKIVKFILSIIMMLVAI